MARPPKSTAAHKRDGTFRDDRHGDRVPDAEFPDAQLACPEDLSGEAAVAWYRVVKSLPPDYLKQADIDHLAGMCRWLAQFNAISAAMEKIEVTAPPYYKLSMLAGMAWKHFAAASSRFGMTPADRAKLRTPVVEKNRENALETLKLLGASA